MSDAKDNNRFEMMAGLTLAIFAAFLAIVDLYAGKFGDDELLGANEKASAFAWYQSKSMKQNMLEQEASLLSALMRAGVIVASAQPSVQSTIDGLQSEILRYKKEKREILEGSSAVGQENQVLEKDGKKGEIIGAFEYEKAVKILGTAGDQFDLGVLYLQVALVLGAMSLMFSDARMRYVFFSGMLALGTLGVYYGVAAHALASTA